MNLGSAWTAMRGHRKVVMGDLLLMQNTLMTMESLLMWAVMHVVIRHTQIAKQAVRCLTTEEMKGGLAS